MTFVDPDLCSDAVIVLPGIIGSELVETATGRVLWGLADPRWYAGAWTTGSSLSALEVTAEERSGRVGRIRATRTIRAAAFAPLLRGFEPYTDLLSNVKRFVVDPAAVMEFPYDWRLAIDHNAAELAKAAHEHLANWRRHPKGSHDAKLLLVAHSMGGLVARYFTQVLGGASDVRATVTLGTPFYGSVQAVVMLSTGRGGPLPLPRQRLLHLARTLPGLHDLLPTYRCVDEGTSSRRLVAADIGSLGGEEELAQQAFDRRQRLLIGSSEGWHALVGVQQPTLQSVRILDGVAEPYFFTCFDARNGDLRRIDRRGDSTVPRDLAALEGAELAYLPQSHSALAKSEEAIAHACAVMTRSQLGLPLGEGGVGLDLPDVVHVGESFEIHAKDLEDPAAIICDVERIESQGTRFMDRLMFVPPTKTIASSEASLVARTMLPEPGVYRVEAKVGAASAVSQLILAVEAEDPGSPAEVDPKK